MKALITGITGQDGSYLAEFLLQRGYTVHGIVRRTSNYISPRIVNLKQNSKLSSNLFIHSGELGDANFINQLIGKQKPEEIYNLASLSHVLESFSYPYMSNQVNALSVISILESIKNFSPESRFYQASTSELFGSTPPPQSEESAMAPRSPYAISKLHAYWTTKNYREAYNLFAVNGILFNHESPRRTPDFVTRKISSGAARIFLKKQDKLVLGNLEAKRDWGYAPEYVVGMWKTLQSDFADDYVLATGKSHSVKNFLDFTFQHLGLDWRNYVEIDKKLYRPTEVDNLQGDLSKANKLLGWSPKILTNELAKIMVEFDIQNEQKEFIDCPDFTEYL